MKIIALLFSLIGSVYGYSAAKRINGKVFKIFQKHYANNYRQGKCESNALELLKGLHKEVPNLEEYDPKIIILEGDQRTIWTGKIEAEKARFVPELEANNLFRGTRWRPYTKEDFPLISDQLVANGFLKTWNFHVFLDLSDVIFDLDAWAPYALRKKYYLQKMFFEQNPIHQKIPFNIYRRLLMVEPQTLEEKLEIYNVKVIEYGEISCELELLSSDALLKETPHQEISLEEYADV